MTKIQKIVMWVGIIAVVGMGLYPPWTTKFTRTGLSACHYKYNPIHKAPHFTLDHPGSENMSLGRGYIDIHRLLVQWAMVAFITGGMVVTCRRKQ